MARAPKEDPYAYKPVDDAWLDFWVEQPVGGSGMSTAMQWRLKCMSIELKKFREAANAES